MVGKESFLQRGSGKFRSYDGLELFDQWWWPQNKLRASVVIIHGLSQHSGLYFEVARFLTAQGYRVDAFDLRGHGKSEGTKVYVESFEDYLKDLDVFLNRVKKRVPDKPVFLLGHSMGGEICALYSITRQPHIRGLILIAPLVKISENISSPFLEKISSVLSKLIPKLPNIKLEKTAFSRDPDVIKNRENDPLVYQGKMLVRTGAELLQGTRLIQAQMTKISHPLLILHGTEDRFSDVEGSKMLYDSVKEKDKTLKLYPGFYHEILNEPEKKQVFKDILTWMNDHTRS